MVPRWRIFDHFWVLHFQRAARSTFQTDSVDYILVVYGIRFVTSNFEEFTITAAPHTRRVKQVANAVEEDGR